MVRTSARKLRGLFENLSPGAPLGTEDLARLDISPGLASHYAKTGWLRHLGRGVYAKPGDQPALKPSLVLLQRTFEGLHVGGKSALDWYGYRHYVAQQPTTHLYAWKAGRLPTWFTERFSVSFHRKRLFRETPPNLLYVTPFEDREREPDVSAPERAMLELLSEVGARQSLQEAREILEDTHSLRASVLGELLHRCTSVKTVRLCLQLGYELALPWAKKLNREELPKGSHRDWVTRTPEGVLVLKA